jgi:hypothetical protein
MGKRYFRGVCFLALSLLRIYYFTRRRAYRLEFSKRATNGKREPVHLYDLSALSYPTQKSKQMPVNAYFTAFVRYALRGIDYLYFQYFAKL